MNVWGPLCGLVAQVFAMPAWAVLLSKATLLLAVAWLIHGLLVRANPRWRMLLWRGAAVGLVLLAVQAGGLPGVEIRVPAPEPVTTTRSPLPQRVAAARDPGVRAQPPANPTESPAPFETTPAVDRTSTEAHSPVGQRVDASGASVPWQAVVLGVWGAGVAWLLVRLGVGYLRFATLLRTCQPAPEAVVAEARRVAAALGCGGAVTVRSSDRFSVPLLCGVRCPVLILPERVCQPSYRSQLPGILAHELTHARSWDLAWNAVVQVVSILLWFHPLAWRIGSAHRAACDRVCDAVSASYLGDVRAYCRTLARLALEAGASAAPVGLAMARGCDVRRRLALLERAVFASPLERRVVVGVALVGLAALALLAAVRLVLAESPSRAGEGQAAASSAQKAPADSPKEQEGLRAGSGGSATPGFRPMRIHVFDPDGKPIVDAGVTVRPMTHLPLGTFRYRTNAEGTAVFDVPEAESLDLQVLVWHKDHVTAGAHWSKGAVSQPVPAEFTVTLQRGTVFGGIVRNEQGQPVAGAEVTVSGHKARPGEVLWLSINDTVTTDAEGKWTSRRVPEVLKGFDVQIYVRHPDYVSPSVFEVAQVPVEDLRAQTAVMVVDQGVAVEGTVTDPEGKPVAGAMVGLFAERYAGDFPRATTDQNGRYRLPASEPGEFTVAAAASGYAPDSRSVTVGTDPLTVDLQLRQGASIRLRVVDVQGEPVPGAAVSTLLPPDKPALHLGLSERSVSTDAQGRWSRIWLPNDELTFYISKPGYAQVHGSFAADEREHVVTLEAGGWTVTGRVVDRQTKAPVTKFRVVEGDTYGGDNRNLSWREGQPVENSSGQYRASWDISGNSRRVVRIEADGYLPSEPRRLEATERQVTFNVELTKGQDVTGVVFSPDGKPLADADVVLSTATRGLYLRNGRPALSQHPLMVRTGPDGRFSFTPQREPYMLIALHDQGYAEVQQGADSGRITLRPWARVEGTLRAGSQPGVKETIRLDFGDLWTRPRETLSLSEQVARRSYFHYETQTDAGGRFVFERVRPGRAKVCHQIQLAREGSMSSSVVGRSMPIELAPGQTVEVDLGGTGRPVTGRVVFANGVPAQFDLSGNAISAERLLPDGSPGDPTTRFGTRLEQDGSFRFDDLPPGEYRLSAYVSPRETMFRREPGKIAGRLSHEFTVPDIPGGRSDQPLELGTLPLD